MTEVTYRAYSRETDFVAVVALEQELNKVEAELGAVRDTSREAAISCLHEDTRSIHEAGGEQLVAEIDGAVIGYAAIELARWGAFVPPDRQAHVHVKNLVVDRAHRRRGIGAAFLARADELARLHGYSVVTLGVVAGNEVAVAGYHKAGFKIIAHEMAKIID